MLKKWFVHRGDKRQKSKYTSVVPKVGGTAPLGAVGNSRGAVKQKWAVRGR